MKILIASDKFKGSLTAPEACEAIRKGIIEAMESEALEIRLLPVADGGDGMAYSLTAADDGEWITVGVKNALGQPTEASYGIIEDGRLAVIEMAEASGLAQLDPASLDPWNASSYGTGELIRDATERGVEHIALGIGGAATNDGGAGMAQALGFQFFNSENELLSSIPAELNNVSRIASPTNLNLPKIIVACDVTNRLLGPSGCTDVCGPQKGIEPESLSIHEERLFHLVQLTNRVT